MSNLWSFSKNFVPLYNIAHGNDVNFQVTCWVGGCLGKFSKLICFIRKYEDVNKQENVETDEGNAPGKENREEDR